MVYYSSFFDGIYKNALDGTDRKTLIRLSAVKKPACDYIFKVLLTISDRIGCLTLL
jgi:hypothetical protein